MNLPIFQASTDLSGIVNTIIIQIFAQNYITFLVTVILALAILLFAYRFTGPESIIIGNVLLGALYLSHINPLFTTLFAAFIIADGLFIILAIWKNLANG